LGYRTACKYFYIVLPIYAVYMEGEKRIASPLQPGFSRARFARH
jgi:hypothetical protein